MSRRAGLFVTALVRIDLDPAQTAAGARAAAAWKCRAAFALVEALERAGILAVIIRKPACGGRRRPAATRNRRTALRKESITSVCSAACTTPDESAGR